VRRFAIVYLLCFATPLVAQQQSAPQMPYHSVPDFFRLPPNIMMGETAAVALDLRDSRAKFHSAATSVSPTRKERP
jgi:hypothetical protein